MNEPDKLDEILDKLKKEQWAIAWSPDTQTGTLTAFTEAKAEISKHYISRDKVREAIKSMKTDWASPDTDFARGYDDAIIDFTERLGL